MSQQNNQRPGLLMALVRSGYSWLVAGCLITVLVMAAYPQLPERRINLVRDQVEAFIYADQSNQVRWLDHSALRWVCEIEDFHQEAFCGFHIHLPMTFSGEGLNLTPFSRIELELDYEGSSRLLRYYFRSHEPGFTDLGDIESHKFQQSQIAVSYLDRTLSIGLDEFYVAEWWLTQFSVPRALSGPSFHHVTAFGVDLPYPAPEGVHEFQLHGAELVGVWVSREQWYAGILWGWVATLALVGAVRLYQLRRRVSAERRRWEEAARRNRELRVQSQRLKVISRTDQLTGLLNRQGLTEEIEKLFSRPNQPLGLMVLDIDHFKSVNDELGHDAGDRVLERLARVLRESLRQSDNVARWGGEEFVLLLPGTDEDNLKALAEKLRQRIAEMEFPELQGKSITASIGVGSRRADEDYHQLFRRVDSALYRAKQSGRNRVCPAR